MATVAQVFFSTANFLFIVRCTVLSFEEEKCPLKTTLKSKAFSISALLQVARIYEGGGEESPGLRQLQFWAEGPTLGEAVVLVYVRGVRGAGRLIE